MNPVTLAMLAVFPFIVALTRFVAAMGFSRVSVRRAAEEACAVGALVSMMSALVITAHVIGRVNQ